MFRVLNLEFYEVEESSVGKQVFVFTAAIVIALIVGGGLMLLVEANPFQAYMALIKGALSSRYAISETFFRTLPLIFVGLGTAISFRAGVWNIGGNGQIYAGGMAATALGLYLQNVSPPILIFMTIVAGALAGGIWSGIAGLLRARFNINEVFVTVMMNYIMFYLTVFMLEEIWRESTYGVQWSEIVTKNCWWPVVIPKTRIHLGLVIVILGVIYIHYLLFRTPFGYEVRAAGHNLRAAFSKCKGARIRRMIVVVMFIAGALAGIAGAGQVCGYQYRFSLEINADYGFLGIIAALLGGLTPVGVVAASFFVGVMTAGATHMQVVTGVPIALVHALEGLVLVAGISARVFSLYRVRWRYRNDRI